MKSHKPMDPNNMHSKTNRDNLRFQKPLTGPVSWGGKLCCWTAPILDGYAQWSSLYDRREENSD